MQHRLFKREIAYVMIFILFISLFGNVPSMAEEEAAKQISIRVEGSRSTVAVTPEGYTTTTVTAWEALKEFLDTQGIPYEVMDTEWGIYIKSIGNEVENSSEGYFWLFALNDKVSNVGAGSYHIQSGDKLLFYYGHYSDTLIPQVSIPTQVAFVNEPLEIVVETTYYDYTEMREVTKKLSNVSVTFDGTEYYTDENGCVVITPSKAGIYVLEIGGSKGQDVPEVVRDQKKIRVINRNSYSGNIDEEISKTILFYDAKAQYLDDWDSHWWDIVSLAGVSEIVQSSVYALPEWSVDCFPEEQEARILDYCRFIFAGTAMGYDPHDLDGKDLVAELASKQQSNGMFGNINNFHVWAMITLDAFNGNYDRDKALQKLLEMQQEDGGFSLAENAASDVDVTSMALIALSEYKDLENVADAVSKAVGFLKNKQDAIGGFEGLYANNCNSTAMAISGLISVGEDIFSEKWKVNGRTPVDALLDYRTESNGFYFSTENTEANLMATSQALIALGDIKYQKSVFKRIGDSEFNIIRAVESPEATPEPSQPEDNDHYSGGGSSKYIYLTVTGDSQRGVIYKRNKVYINNNDTPYSVLKREVPNVKATGSGSNLYVKEVDGLGEFDRGPLSGWKYKVNGVEIQESAGTYKLKSGDDLHWFYDGEEGNKTSGTPSKKSTFGNVSKEETSETISESEKLDVENILSNKIKNGVEALKTFGNMNEWSLFVYAKSSHLTYEYKENFIQFIKQEEGNFRKVTDMALAIINATALGLDPCNIEGYNLLEKLYNHSNILMQGINGPAFSLIAFDAGNYEIPEHAKCNREEIIRLLLDAQNDDGGFSLMQGSPSDVDITAFVITALSPYQEVQGVSEAIEKAMKWLESIKTNDGGYKSKDGIENSESLSWVIIAKSALGLDCEAEIKELYNYINEDGTFSHIKGEKADMMATEQGLMALLAYKRYINGQEGLFRQLNSDRIVFYDWADMSDWAVPYMEKGLEYNIIKGDQAGLIHPKAYVTRAELATMLVRLKGLEPFDGMEEVFHDVKKEDWYYPTVMSAYKMGLVRGRSGSRFEPDSWITREEMAVLISRMLNENHVGLKKPNDMAQVSEWAKSAVETVFGLGIMLGDGSHFEPSGYVTREMAVKTIVLIYERGDIQ